MAYQVLTAMVVLLASLEQATAQIIPRGTRAKRVCCLKDYGYRQNELSAPVTAATFDGILVPAGGTLSTSSPRDVKTFPMRQMSLRNNHCELRDVVFVVRRDGQGTLTFQVRQDPNLVEETQRPKFVRFQRNCVYVSLRLIVGDVIAAAPNGKDGVAAPSAGAIQIPGFWIQQSETTNMTLCVSSKLLCTHFDQIRRIEIDLQYE